MIVMDALLPRNKWAYARVTKLYPDRDNVVRVVQIATAKHKDGDIKSGFGISLLDRPISKLILVKPFDAL